MKNNFILPALYLVIFVFVILLYVVTPSSQNKSVSLIYTAVTFLPSFAGIYTLRYTGTGSAFGKSILLGTIGLWSWAIAESIRYVFAFVLHVNPYPSVADIFVLLPYPVFFAALLVSYKSFGVPILKLPKKLLAINSLIVIALSLPVFYFGVYSAYDSEVGVLQNILSLPYGVADLVLMAASLLVFSLVRDFSRSRFGYFWITITIGFAIFLTADVLFSIFNIEHSNDLKPYTYIDLLWVGGYLLFSYAMLDIALYLKKLHRTMRDEVSGIVG